MIAVSRPQKSRAARGRPAPLFRRCVYRVKIEAITPVAIAAMMMSPLLSR
jgi:hypothetical protein